MANSLSCISVNHQERQARPQVFNVNGDEPVFFHLVLKQVNIVVVVIISIIRMQKSDVVKNLNIKVFNLMSRTNDTRHIKWHKMCKCEC